MASLFTKIVRGELPSHKIAEDDRFYAFLDIRPMSKGHTLVVPKEEVDYFFDLDDAHLSGVMVFARKVSRAIESVVSCRRVGVAVVGLEVPHAHVHLIPITRMSDMNFGRPPVKMSEEEMEELAARIRAAYDG